MNFRKNFANYIAWGLMCIILFAGVGVSAIGVSERAQNDAYLLYVGAFYLIFLALIAILIPVYKAIKEFIETKLNFSNFKFEGAMEIIYIVVIVLASIIIRFAYAISIFLKTDSSEILLGTTAYFDYAQGLVSGIGTGNNGAYIFTSLLGVFFNFFSDKIIAVYVLQAIFALGTILFSFFTIRKLSGNLTAGLYLLLAAFLPGSLELFMYCTPGLMLAFLFSGYFFGIVHLIKAYQTERITDSKIFVYYVLAGVFTGFICYFDPIGLPLIPLTAYGIAVFKKQKAEDSHPEKYEDTKKQILYYVASAIIFLILSLFAYPAGIDAGATGVARYFSLFVPNGGLNLSILTPHYGSYDSLAVYVLAGLWFLAFLKAIRDRVFPISIVTIFMVLFCLVNFDHLDYSALVSTCFLIIGSYGLKSLSFLILPVEAENVEEAKAKLAEMDRKKRSKDNKKLERKLEKQSKRAIKHGNGIILGKNIEHDIIPEDEETKPEQTVAENVAESAADTEVKEENTKTAETVASEGTSEKKEETVVEETAANVENKENAPEEKVPEENVSGETVSAETVSVENTENSENTEQSVTEENTGVPVVEEVAVAETVTENVTEPAETIPAEEAVGTDTVAEVAVEGTNETTEAVAEAATETTTDAPAETPEEPKKEMPVYVPMVMVRRRGKMFSPVKKAEPAPETTEETAAAPSVDLVAVSAAVAASATANANAEAAAENVPETPVEVAFETQTAGTEVAAETANTSEPAEVAIVTEPAETVTETTEAVAETPVEVPETTTESIKASIVPSAPAIPGSVVPAETPAEPTETAETTENTSANTAETQTSESSTTASSEETPADSAEEKEVKLIKNPVPQPKEHVTKELSFDYDPRDDELDFDLKDLNGKDFYDI